MTAFRPRQSESTGDRPLSDLRVLDISNFLAAPMCSMFLADFGADVLKVERPGTGDEVRYWGNEKDGVGLYYKVLNRGKRSITLDLRTPLGVEIVKRLVEDVDVIVENYRPGTIERWGLSYEALSKINPALIMVRISGFGQTGPYSERPGFGTLAEAYSGFAHINGEAEGPPLLPGFGLADSTTGMMAAYLTMVAVHEQRRSGKGQVIDLALYETLFTLLGPQVVDFDQLGLVQQRNGSRLPFTAPRNTYRTKDGRWISIGGSAQTTFERICKALGVPELVTDSRFAGNRLRLTNARELDVELQAAVGSFDYEELDMRFRKHQATMAPVNDVSQFMVDEHVLARQNIVAVEDGELNASLRMQNVAGKFSRTPGRIAHAGPPLGAQNVAVLVDALGYDPDVLRAAGIDVGDAGEAGRPARTASR